MRCLLGLFAALILMAPPATYAQPRQGGGGRAQPPPTMPTSPTMPPLPPSVAPPITYPFAPLMPPPPGGLTPRVGEGQPFRTRDRRFWGAGSTGYGYLGYQEPEPFTRQGRPPAAATGLLQLAVTPASAQVLVDSYYVGTVEDVNAQRVLELEAGPHRVEFRAPQYQTLTVDVRILPLETVTYRGALEPSRPVAPAQTTGPPTVMYVIPKCYAGNLPPRQSRLPSGCDVKQVQVLNPPATPSQR